MNISEDGKRSSEGLNTKITAIAAFSKGFACASGVGTVHLFEKGEDKDFYKKIRVVKVMETKVLIRKLKNNKRKNS